jgi:hypothetical protein
MLLVLPEYAWKTYFETYLLIFIWVSPSNPSLHQDENNTLTDGQDEPGIWNTNTKK